MKRDKELLVWLLAMLFVRVLFLLWDTYFSHVSKEIQDESKQIWTEKNIVMTQDIDMWNQHGSARESQMQPIDSTVTDMSEYEDILQSEIQEELYDLWFEEDDINLEDTGINYEDVSSLQKIYETNHSPEILNLLISKLVQWYQFWEARQYLADINIFKEPNISIKDYIYVYINTLSITDSTSISKFKNFIDEAKNNYYISNDDYTFYSSLVELRNGNYSTAMSGLSTITTPVYQTFVSQISDAISKYSVQQWVPLYYKDALISLVCLKNGYFTLANKLSVQASLQNMDYILPYQILAYSNFLTQDREKAVDYFYKLSSLDPENYEKYNFYIWISYYRFWNYEKSIAALVPLINSSYQSDVYRYLLLDYEKIWDQNKKIQIRQKQLWNSSLKDSDFQYFFDQIFYIPFANGEKFGVYREYKQMVYDFVTACYEKLGADNATCIYGSVWLDIANSNWRSVRDNLLYLVQNYPQASIYQALWNYYKIIWDEKQSKNYFLKAVSMSQNTTQKNLIESTLIKNISD